MQATTCIGFFIAPVQRKNCTLVSSCLSNAGSKVLRICIIFTFWISFCLPDTRAVERSGVAGDGADIDR